ncbi:hypothetical protein ES703_101965 [subsurface metagenome]
MFNWKINLEPRVERGAKHFEIALPPFTGTSSTEKEKGLGVSETPGPLLRHCVSVCAHACRAGHYHCYHCEDQLF